MSRINKALQAERQAREAMGYVFFSRPPLASTARHVMRVPLQNAATDELCLFVTHASGAELKPHVIDYVNALLDAYVPVVLIANTDLEPAVLQIPPAFAARLHGCMIRQNVGYDFGAWAHAYSVLAPNAVRRRLYLINDSIVGPLDWPAYHRLLQRIRDLQADFAGLTSHPDPHDHLQSYYLVFNESVLRSPLFDTFMQGVVNMPRKQAVIECYELWLTPFLEQSGFRGSALFPNLSADPPFMRNDTLWKWKELIDAGFPFIKSSVLTQSGSAEAARGLLPARYALDQAYSSSRERADGFAVNT